MGGSVRRVKNAGSIVSCSGRCPASSQRASSARNASRYVSHSSDGNQLERLWKMIRSALNSFGCQGNAPAPRKLSRITGSDARTNLRALSYSHSCHSGGWGPRNHFSRSKLQWARGRSRWLSPKRARWSSTKIKLSFPHLPPRYPQRQRPVSGSARMIGRPRLTPPAEHPPHRTDTATGRSARQAPERYDACVHSTPVPVARAASGAAPASR